MGSSPAGERRRRRSAGSRPGSAAASRSPPRLFRTNHPGGPPPRPARPPPRSRRPPSPGGDRAPGHEAVGGLTAGTLDVVALPTLAVDPLATLVGSFRHAHPDVVVRVDQPEDAAAVATRVRSGRSEIGLTELPVAEPGLVSRQLTEQELIVVLPPDSPLPPPRRPPTADLASVPLVTSPPGTSTRGLIDAAFAVIDDAPLIAVETDQREAIVPLVVAGARASVLPRPQTEAAALFGATTVPLSPRLVRSVGLIWRDGPVSPAARAFIEAGAAFSPRPRPGAPDRPRAR